MTAVFPVGLGTAACRGPKYFLLCSYLPLGFVSVKFAPLTVEADVRLGTDVCIRLPRVVAMTAWGSTAPLVSAAALCLPGAAAALGQLRTWAGGCDDGVRPAYGSAVAREGPNDGRCTNARGLVLMKESA